MSTESELTDKPQSTPSPACCEECARESRGGPKPLSLNLAPPRKNPRKYPVTPWSAQRLYRPFIRWALGIGVLLGFATGAGMLLARGFGVSPGLWWVTHAQSHGVAQLFGFAGLFTMGVAFHVIPRFRNGRMPFPVPQRLVLAAMVGGVVVRFTGQSISDHPAVSGPLLVLSGVLMFAAIVGFALVGGRALASGSARRGPAERWLSAGIAWLVIAGALQLAISIRMAVDGTVIAYGPWNNALISAGLLGFLGCFIFGVSTRTVTGFLGLSPMFRPMELPAFVAFNAGLATSVAGGVVWGSTHAIAAGSLLSAVGIGLFIAALRILEPSATSRRPMPGAYAHYSWFLRSAFAWAAVYAVLAAIEAVEVLATVDLLPGVDAKPTLHVLTLGFITSMIIGMASRMIPLFEGSVIRGHRLLDFAWVALMSSVGLRVVFGFTRSGADVWLAVSGVLGLTAITLFAWLLLGSITRSARETYRQAAAEIGRVRWQAAPR